MTLIHVVPSGEWAGPERYAFDICRHYRSHGWETKVLTRDARAVDGPFRAAGIEVRHAPLRQYPDYYSARALARLFKDMPPGEGIVHVHRYNDALTCILARYLSGRRDIRLIATRHKAERGRDSLLRRAIYSGLDAHLFVSEFSKEIFYKGWKPGRSPLPVEKTDITYNSLLLPACSTPEAPGKGPVSAAYRGKLKPGKGLETLIDAFGLLKDSKVRLRIMGRGNPDYVDGLRRRAHMLGIAEKIDWSRHTDFADSALAKVHFGVLPSEEPEAFGMANLEFMACGRPQISTFSGAEREVLLPGEDSLAVPTGDPQALAEAIRRLADDADLRDAMGSRAYRRFMEKFSWPIFISRLEKHYLPSDNPS